MLCFKAESNLNKIDNRRLALNPDEYFHREIGRMVVGITNKQRVFYTQGPYGKETHESHLVDIDKAIHSDDAKNQMDVSNHLYMTSTESN